MLDAGVGGGVVEPERRDAVDDDVVCGLLELSLVSARDGGSSGETEWNTDELCDVYLREVCYDGLEAGPET